MGEIVNSKLCAMTREGIEIDLQIFMVITSHREGIESDLIEKVLN